MQGLNDKQWREVANSSDLKSFPKDSLSAGVGILDFLVETGVASSKGEARRAIEKDRSVKLNMEGVGSIEATVGTDDSFLGKYIYVQKGKKNKFIISVG